MRLLQTLFFSIFFFGSISAQDSTIAPIKSDAFLFEMDSLIHYQELFEYAGLVYDKEGKYTIEDLFNTKIYKDFKPLSINGKRITSFASDDVPWCRLLIKNNTSKHLTQTLNFSSNPDSILIYVKGNDNKIDFFKVGKLIPSKEVINGSAEFREVYDHQMPILLHFEKDEQKEIYFKTSEVSAGSTWIRPILMSLEHNYKLLAKEKRQDVVRFLYMGLILMFALYNLLIFIFYRESTYLFLSIFAFCFAFPNVDTTMVFINKTWIPAFSNFEAFKLIILNPLTYISISYFSRAFLNSKINFPRSDKYLMIIAGMGFINLSISLAYYAFTGHVFPDLFHFIFIVLAILIFILIFVDLNKHKVTVVRFWLASFFFLSIFFLSSILLSILFPNFHDSLRSFLYPISFGQYGTLILISVLTLGVGYRSREIATEKIGLEEKDKLKSRFFANISHEFRTPLTLIIGPIKQLLGNVKDPKDQKLLQLAHRNGQRLLQLINQLLDLSKLEAGKMKLKVKDQNFPALLKGIVMSFESLASRKNIRLHFVSQKDDIPMIVDTDKIEKIFYNLLSNAFKFTPENGEISVMVTEQSDGIEIIIRDNGIGIPEERTVHIFDRFYQVDSSETREHEGTGVGLALVKELVELHSGEIKVKSKPEKGTEFTIYLPKGKSHFSESEMDKEAMVSPKEYMVPLSLPETRNPISKSDGMIMSQSELPVVLIIEDNVDVREYIKQYLDSSFQILEAIDGQEGVEMALEQLPDLVISDVMMPKKNGYEVCETLKTDERTSHIPVILLTAKAAQEEKLMGLETGADDYLVKPFDTKELEVRVRNLIELRKQLRKQFSHNALIKQPKGINSVDKAFFEKVYHIVEENLSNEQFSVDVFAREVGMSRAHLNRKLNALTDQSANKFIQSFRLLKAMEMLQNKSGNVSEIALQLTIKN